jgi:hypothetical protein
MSPACSAWATPSRSKARPHGIKGNCVFPYAVSEIARDTPLTGAGHERKAAALRALSPQRTPESVATLIAPGQPRLPCVGPHLLAARRPVRPRLPGGRRRLLAGDVGAVGRRDLLAHWPEIDDITRSSAPSSITEEVEDVLHRVRPEAAERPAT